MPLSNQIPSSRLIQPGVVDSAATRPASPFEGQCIFQKDTDQLLVWNGTAWVIPNSPAQNPDGLALITTGSLSGATTNFAGCFTSTYDNYKIVISSVAVSASLDIYWRMLSGTTPNTTANYNYAMYSVNESGGSSNIVSTGTPQAYTGLSVTGTGLSNIPFASGVMDVYSPKLTQRTYVTSQSLCVISSTFTSRSGMSSHYLANSYDGIQFLTASTDTMTGTVSIYGYRK